jgi:hypothetical protein
VRFRTVNRQLRNSSAYSKSQQLLLKQELRNKQRDKGKVSLQLGAVRLEVFSVLSPLDACAFRLWLALSNRKFDTNIKSIHNKKLLRLNPDALVQQLSPDDVILNLSSHTLTSVEKQALGRGLNFAFAPSHSLDLEFSTSLELAARRLRSQIPDDNRWSDARNLLRACVPPTLNPPSCATSDKHLLAALKGLGKNDSLYISKHDKGNGVVILNKTDYIVKMNKVLNDPAKFIIVDDDCYKLSQKLESKLNSTLLSLHKKGRVDKSVYNSIRACGSFPGKLYGLPKTHKTGVPVRPILSAVTCHNYNLAKFLVPLLNPLTVSDNNISDTFQFADTIRKRVDLSPTLMVSFDVESLFTNVPVLETVNIILDQLFPTNCTYYGFTRSEFHSLLMLAVDDSYFVFNGKLYKQIDGMAMGSPLGPIFANIFLTHFENTFMKNAPVQPLFYKRYVDDTFWLLPVNSDVDSLLTYLNSCHPNMKFTYETECNNALHFIGLTVSHDVSACNFGFSTTVYRKPTSTSLYMNFNSFTPLQYRLSVFKCLVFRALKLCSSWASVSDEIQALRSMLLRNAFPSWVLDRIIRFSLNSFLNPTLRFGPAKERLYVGLPFLGKQTDIIRKKLIKVFKQFVPHKDLIIYFRPGRRVGNFFHIKDLTPTELRSSIVYRYTCTSCQASYIGQTARHFRHRIAEHMGVSHLTWKEVKIKVHSNIREHVNCCPNSSCTPQNFKIIATGGTEQELLIKERLLITKEKPLLNGNTGSYDLLLY